VIRAQEELTPEQEAAAKFWEGGEGTALPPGIWMQVVLERLNHEPLTTPRETRLFATLTVAMDDAGVDGWDSKYARVPRHQGGQARGVAHRSGSLGRSPGSATART